MMRAGDLCLICTPLRGGIKKEGRHPDDQSSNFKNLIP